MDAIDWGPYPLIMEPCRGDGAITDVLAERGLDAYLNWCEIQEGRDFLTYEAIARYDYCISNPPYSLAQEFIDHSLEIANCVIMLLRLNYLGAQCRREWWQTRQPHEIYVLPRRPSFTGKGTDACEYGWFVWHSGQEYTGTQLHWL